MNRLQTSPSILIITGAKGDTRRYRAFHLYQQLQLAGIPVTARHISDSDLLQLAATCQYLVLHRVPFNAFVNQLIENVHQRDGLVLADEDDLIFDPSAFEWIDSPDFKDPIRAKLYQREMESQRETLLASDGAVTSTDYLAKVVAHYKNPVWVHRNAANLEMVEISARAVQQKRQPDGRYVIGYASGTLTHNRDFASIAPAVLNTIVTIPQAELWVIGYLDIPSVLDAVSHRVRRIKPVPWRQLPFLLAQFDVNLAPLLLDNPFSQSKSEIKYLEAALVGVPTIASPTDAFQFAIRHGQNGLLAGNLEEWQEAITQLADPDRRAILAEHAGQELPQYAPQTRSQQAVDLLNHISEHFSRSYRWPQPEVTPLTNRQYYWPEKWENKPSNLQLGLYSLRSRGVFTLLKQIWITLRRFFAHWFPYK